MGFLQSLLGKASGNVAEVDGNDQLLVALNTDPTKIGGVKLYDADGNAITVEENGSLAVSQDSLIFTEQVDGNTINTNKWITSASVLALAQASGYITLNSANAVTANGYAILTSILNLPFYGDLPTEVVLCAKISAQPQANATIELGLGYAATNATPTDGAFFRWSATGSFLAVVNNSGAETTASAGTAPANGIKTTFGIIVAEDHVQFIVNDVKVADIANPAGLSYPFNAGHQPIFARVVTGSGSPSQAPQVSIGQITGVQLSINQYREWRHVLADMGLSSYQSPTTFAQTGNRANSSAPASLTPSNTVAGSAALGGEWQIAAAAAANTDLALFAFQVSAQYRLKVYGVRIWSAVSGAAIVTPAILDWALGINGSAVSLATADSPPTSWAPRRIPIGSHCFIAGAGIGTSAPDINQRFDAPLIVDSLRYLHVILRVPNGAATSSLLYRGGVFIDGQFE